MMAEVSGQLATTARSGSGNCETKNETESIENETKTILHWVETFLNILCWEGTAKISEKLDVSFSLRSTIYCVQLLGHMTWTTLIFATSAYVNYLCAQIREHCARVLVADRERVAFELQNGRGEDADGALLRRWRRHGRVTALCTGEWGEMNVQCGLRIELHSEWNK
jgi:hypothetical protein